MSFFLPFALRAASTLRPFAVDILSLKPCLWRRLVFEGWYVLFIFLPFFVPNFFGVQKYTFFLFNNPLLKKYFLTAANHILQLFSLLYLGVPARLWRHLRPADVETFHETSLRSATILPAAAPSGFPLQCPAIPATALRWFPPLGGPRGVRIPQTAVHFRCNP